MLDHEINIMYMCNHPNIIRLFEDYETSDEIYLVMELIKGGDLFDYITKHRRFDEPTSSLMIKDVAEALLYLHAKKIVHRDLKPENLLVMQRKDGRITIKITDFWFSYASHRSSKNCLWYTNVSFYLLKTNICKKRQNIFL